MLLEDSPAELAPMRRHARLAAYQIDDEPLSWPIGRALALACALGGAMWLAIILPIVWLFGGL